MPSAPGATRTARSPSMPRARCPMGRHFKGPDELKSILKEKEGLFARCLTEKMLTYALGRGLEYYDRCAVDTIVAALARDDYRFSTLVDGSRKERSVPDANGDRRESHDDGRRPISRRTVLRGLGTAMALALARGDWPLAVPLALAAGRPCRRGAWRSSTCPTASSCPTGRRRPKGRTSSCRRSSSRWPRSRTTCSSLSGLTCDKARANGDGAGDHARASAAFLTGVPGAQDRRRQLPRRHLGRPGRRRPARRPHPASRRSSSASSATAAPAIATAAIRASTNTRSPGDRRPRRCRRRSIPGWSSIGSSPSRPNDPDRLKRNRLRPACSTRCCEDARDLERQLGGTDRQKLDQYLTCVRELEQRIARAETLPPVQPPGGRRQAAECAGRPVRNTSA